jgi:hypothetical protein
MNAPCSYQLRMRRFPSGFLRRRFLWEDIAAIPYFHTGFPYCSTGFLYFHTGLPYCSTGFPYFHTGFPYCSTGFPYFHTGFPYCSTGFPYFHTGFPYCSTKVPCLSTGFPKARRGSALKARRTRYPRAALLYTRLRLSPLSLCLIYLPRLLMNVSLRP